MHSISPYLIRCFNPAIEGKVEQRYSNLDKIGQNDLFVLICTFIKNQSGQYQIIEKTKQVYNFSEISIDERYREIYCWFNVGHYGTKTDIIDVTTGKIDYKKTNKNAEIIKHFIKFYIPRNVNEAMCFFHSYRGDGIKTLFSNIFCDYFNEATKLNLQIKPLSYKKAITAWLDAQIKEIRVVKFSGLKDIADQVKHLGHNEQVLSIKPPRKGSFGKFKDYITKDTNEYQMIEVLSDFGSQIKTVVEFEGRKRTFTVGSNASEPIAEIELDDNVILVDGFPELKSIAAWVKEIIKDFNKHIYPGMKMEVSP